ncbi:hypothetical protein MIMGU_mgv1a017087mg [Erythranthe guttata]|uniref:Uncharacterized protein n=1 Tax=Erythranthe guttata TaxID=4155 RepID=A0A022QX77_ERYGU|nr:hypothetical protein MIMGU_mgv1a017087mg [Erythranthe guttata]
MIEHDLEIAAIWVEMLRRQKEFIEYRKSTLKMRKKFLAGSSSLMATSLKELFFIEDLVKNHGYKGKIYASAPLTRGCAEGFGQTTNLKITYVE